jgi:hypothetical protein
MPDSQMNESEFDVLTCGVNHLSQVTVNASVVIFNTLVIQDVEDGILGDMDFCDTYLHRCDGAPAFHPTRENCFRVSLPVIDLAASLNKH